MENTNEGSKDTIEKETATTNENKMTENSPKSEIAENDAEQAVTDKAASGTKSRIRSRWYRANERPLESQSTPVANPTGEITLTEGAVLKDDLSNATPPTGGGGREERGRDGDRRGGRDGDRHGGRDGDRRGGRDGGGRRRNESRNRHSEGGPGREDQRDRNSSPRDEQEKHDGERNRSRRRSGNRNRNRNRSDKESQGPDGGQGSGKHRKDSRNSKSNENTSTTRKKTDAPTKKKSGGVGSFWLVSSGANRHTKINLEGDAITWKFSGFAVVLP